MAFLSDQNSVTSQSLDLACLIKAGSGLVASWQQLMLVLLIIPFWPASEWPSPLVDGLFIGSLYSTWILESPLSQAQPLWEVCFATADQISSKWTKIVRINIVKKWSSCHTITVIRQLVQGSMFYALFKIGSLLAILACDQSSMPFVGFCSICKNICYIIF